METLYRENEKIVHFPNLFNIFLQGYFDFAPFALCIHTL